MVRREVLHALALAPAALLTGCWCNVKTLPPRLPESVPDGLTPFLRPSRVNKPCGVPSYAIDVHAHFFNASDVPVKGLMEGPIAHLMEGGLATLVRMLAASVQELAAIAPDAAAEYDELIQRRELSVFAAKESLAQHAGSHRQALSERAYEILRKNRPFVAEYNRLVATQSRNFLLPSEAPQGFSRDSVRRAMERGRALPLDVVGVEFKKEAIAAGSYPDGILAFVGYMLSYRYMNLLEFQHAYTTDDEAFGIDLVCGSMVDLDHWLDCNPRSPHEDQVKLHQLLSILSGGYMRPLVAYNPWSDVLNKGASLERVVQAVKDRSFVGVKIYPPSGFRPWGNEVGGQVGPPWKQVNERLAKFWTTCAQMEIPVMAHTSQSMGADDARDQLGGAPGWVALLESFPTPPPRINLAHFGGDKSANQWTNELAKLMEHPAGSKLFGDLAYWDTLGCTTSTNCSGRTRLNDVVREHNVVRERLMYGSDWLMLSREPDWKAFPYRVAAAMSPATLDPKKIFAENAHRCFPSIER